MTSDFAILTAGLALLALYLGIGADIRLWLRSRALSRRVEAEHHLLVVETMIARPPQRDRRHA